MSAWAVQKAIYSALTADINTPIYDGAPMDAALPYVDLGEVDGIDWSAKTESGIEHRFRLHIWSGYQGKKECLDIMGQIHSTLHKAELSIDGQTLVLLRFDNQNVFRDIGGQAWHGTMDIRAVTQQT